VGELRAFIRELPDDMPLLGRAEAGQVAASGGLDVYVDEYDFGYGERRRVKPC
jgi:hypothetical protein